MKRYRTDCQKDQEQDLPLGDPSQISETYYTNIPRKIYLMCSIDVVPRRRGQVLDTRSARTKKEGAEDIDPHMQPSDRSVNIRAFLFRNGENPIMSLPRRMMFCPAEQGNVDDQNKESNEQAASNTDAKVAETMDKSKGLLWC